jgi:hypothetical protein
MHEVRPTPDSGRLEGLSVRNVTTLMVSGYDIGTALGHYLVWLGSSAAQTGAPKLYFLSREGAWLANHYSRLRSSHPDGSSWPIPITLAVSRRSTFLPSLPLINRQALSPLLAQYPHALSSIVLQSLGLDLSATTSHQGSITSGLPLNRPWAESGVAEDILRNAWISAGLERRRITQREALCRYLAQEGVMDVEPLVVADIGWRGTIQDNLARVMPARCVIGFYLALFPPLSPAPPNTEKHGFIHGPTDSAWMARRLRFVAPLEFVATGEAQSILGYKIDTGSVRAITDMLSIAPLESPAFRCFQQAVSIGVDAAAETREPSPALARKRVLQMIETPPSSLVNLFFDAWRDDRYGAGVIRRGAPRLRRRRIISALASRNARRAVGIELNNSGWPWGLLVRDMPVAAPLLRRLILSLDVRL